MYLLDTNALIWTLFDPDKLSTAAKDVIIDEKNDLYVSIASLWEISIKRSLGKLEIEKDPVEIAAECEREQIHVLSVKPVHLKRLEKLPFVHRDPFDRLYIAQANVEGLTIITKDSVIPGYDVKTLW